MERRLAAILAADVAGYARITRADELAQMFVYFENHTYPRANHDAQIKLANVIAGKPAADFASWTKKNFKDPAAANSTGPEAETPNATLRPVDVFGHSRPLRLREL